MQYGHLLAILLLPALLQCSQLQDVAETDEGSATPVEASMAADTTGQSIEADPCEGMAQADYLGSEACADCHEGKLENMLASPHGQMADPRSPASHEGCESCHGPAMMHFENEGMCIISMAGNFGESAGLRNAVCLQCHQDSHRMHWSTSTHNAEELACVDCHAIHKPDTVMERVTESAVCFTCHRDIRSQIFRASSHPVRENKVICRDCHNSHGAAGPAALHQYTVNENCYACHAEKRGPFLWEHYPVSEDCTLCHRVHGSNHQALLTRPGPQLCQQCHADISSGEGHRHIRRFMDYTDPDPGRARFKVALNCANCHSKIHGSNHPSGAALMR